ncbi:MAG: hypothetical protein ACE5FE_06290 [Acidiferrobacterales bacterium]
MKDIIPHILDDLEQRLGLDRVALMEMDIFYALLGQTVKGVARNISKSQKVECVELLAELVAQYELTLGPLDGTIYPFRVTRMVADPRDVRKQLNRMITGSTNAAVDEWLELLGVSFDRCLERYGALRTLEEHKTVETANAAQMIMLDSLASVTRRPVLLPVSSFRR